MPRNRSWDDADLAAAVAASTTMSEVYRRLGLVPGKYESLLRHINRLGIDTSHFVVRKIVERRKWSDPEDDELVNAVRESSTVSDVLRRLGYEPSGGMHRWVVRNIRLRGLDTSHFLGQGWAQGRKWPGRRAIPLEEILVANSAYSDNGGLRQRLIAAGLKKRACEQCGLSTWRGVPIKLELDHINGNHVDNRLENLRILCPNCHSLTETWCKPKPA